MKRKNFTLLIALIFGSAVSYAQNNVFPANGWVGVGTASPASAFNVNASGYAGMLLGNNDATGFFVTKETSDNSFNIWSAPIGTGPNRFKIASNGYVGIGTTSPDQLFTVNGNTHLGMDLNLTRTDNQGYAASIVVDNVTCKSIYFQKIGGGNIDLINMLATTVGVSGSLGINTLNTQGYQLAVNGSAIFTRAVVKLYPNWPDYVFARDYKLPSLRIVEDYIKTNNHLPGMPAAEEVRRIGLDLGNNQAKLLQKIEELTLYAIELEKKVDKLEEESKKFNYLKQQIDELKNLVKK